MDLEIQNLLDWFEENKEWLLVPAIINAVIILLGILIILLLGRGANFLIKAIFLLLIIAAPFGGYFLGDYVDPYLSPIVAKINDFVSQLISKVSH